MLIARVQALPCMLPTCMQVTMKNSQRHGGSRGGKPAMGMLVVMGVILLDTAVQGATVSSDDVR